MMSFEEVVKALEEGRVRVAEKTADDRGSAKHGNIPGPYHSFRAQSQRLTLIYLLYFYALALVLYTIPPKITLGHNVSFPLFAD